MNCPALIPADGQPALGAMLRGLDCMTAQASATGFARLLGSHGALTGALTLALTLYVALLALGLMSGRASLSLSTLTPRMMTLGLALTFATSWMAYSQTVWTLLANGPDWLASQMLGLRGSAAQALAVRLDGLFGVLMDAARAAQEAQGDAKGIQPADLLNLSALVLMLGSVGVLVTSRIVLAVLLTLGPVFVVLSIFGGTRGLFEGWLKAAVGFALVPLFAVLLGAGVTEVLTPMLRSMAQNGISMEEAAAVLLAATIHSALMVLALKVTAMLTAGWRLPWGQGAQDQQLSSPLWGNRFAPPAPPNMQTIAQSTTAPQPAAAATDRRIRAILAATAVPMPAPLSLPMAPARGAHAAAPALPASGQGAASRQRQLARQITRKPSV
ncbi:type IV secretion system protein [Novosphingobium umbonatum]|nr:type IV secretion system protein [Novosphingobium umbonatum]